MTDRLSAGDAAPDFSLTSDTEDEVSLADLRGRKVIVYFYPAAMTPGCTKQACDFTESLDSLRGAGYEVLGVSKDAPAKLAKFRERDSLTALIRNSASTMVIKAVAAAVTRLLMKASASAGEKNWSRRREAYCPNTSSGMPKPVSTGSTTATMAPNLAKPESRVRGG